ncbi:hypothetical protein C1Y18_19285 [Pseudomonas sp. MPR-R5A]|nr:hypothetical protein C1Y20_11100 [Pseudomonas sp. FW301-21B01]PMY05489.1 hypothetical protein C1Y18_19285 [Pseudomonas sp. MPR-R5A]
MARELGPVAAFGPTAFWGLGEYISVAAVTAAYGSALTAGHFWKRRAPKVTKNASPHHSVPRLGSVCPNAGLFDGAIPDQKQKRGGLKADLIIEAYAVWLLFP